VSIPEDWLICSIKNCILDSSDIKSLTARGFSNSQTVNSIRIPIEIEESIESRMATNKA
jgi:hypothetical protein